MLKGKEKKHLLNKLAATWRMIWDLEFMKFQRQTLREEIRQQRDRVYESIDALTKSLDSREDKESDTYKVLQSELSKKENALQELEGQIRLLDMEISGDNGPELEPSIQVKINSAHDLLEMLKAYINVRKKN